MSDASNGSGAVPPVRAPVPWPGLLALAASVLTALVALFGYFLAYFAVLPAVALLVCDVVVIRLWPGRSRLFAVMSLLIALAVAAYVTWFIVVSTVGLG